MKKISIYVIFCLFLSSACSGDADMNGPYGSRAIPAQVTVKKVTNNYGESVIYYDRPEDANLKYVKAVYTMDDGTSWDANASYYTDSIRVNGFAKEGEYEVMLYSVSYGEVYSAPVTVRVNPFAPPYVRSSDFLVVDPTFGGISITTKNETGAKLSIGTFIKDSTGEWKEIGMYYSTAKLIRFAVRGQQSVESEFGLQVRDRWGHLSGMRTFTTTPLYEEICDKNLFKSDPIITDTYEMHTWGTTVPKFENLWDGKILTNGSLCFHTKPTAPMPQYFTVDLGKEYKLSRFIVHGRGQTTETGASSNTWTYLFAQGHPKNFELWGSTGPDRVTGKFDDTWFKIEDFTIKRADGSTANQSESSLTDEDKALLIAGHEFDVPTETSVVRWIRFRTINTYGAVNAVMLDELTFYGAEAE